MTDTYVLVSGSRYLELQKAFLDKEVNNPFSDEVHSLAKENYELKKNLAKKAVAEFAEQLENKMMRDIYMALADALKHGRSNNDMDTIQAVERYLRKQGFGPSPFNQEAKSNLG